MPIVLASTTAVVAVCKRQLPAAAEKLAFPKTEYAEVAPDSAAKPPIA